MTNADEKLRRKALRLNPIAVAKHEHQQQLRAEETRLEFLRQVLAPDGAPLGTLTRATHDLNPSETYRRFLDLLDLAHIEDLTAVQRLPWFIYTYDSEVQNGGHAQYFVNQGLHHASHTHDALVQIQASSFASRLQEAIERNRASALPEPRCLNEALRQVSVQEYLPLDLAYYRERPPMAFHLAAYLERHLEHFFRLSAGA